MHRTSSAGMSTHRAAQARRLGITFEADDTCPPPTRSICRPTRRPSSPEITGDAEKAAKNQFDEMLKSCAMEWARIAGRY